MDIIATSHPHGHILVPSRLIRSMARIYWQCSPDWYPVLHQAEPVYPHRDADLPPRSESTCSVCYGSVLSYHHVSVLTSV